MISRRSLVKGLLSATLAAPLGLSLLPAAEAQPAPPPPGAVPPGPPPPPRREPRPAARRGYVWVPGHWNWSARYRWVWVPGHWEEARRGFVYAGPRWVLRRGRWVYEPGRWVRAR
ncbi:YXWGXW repeat-containing protein [Ancylobacter radicis]|uniref:YXWGXW repeat-containing protein n=1 Tax=Ancylobacter radicis TaxID=2836179 RepID=A0ABS5R8L3_9HYPH|nr:YXWGXW repeat-containing protein [Ancylobacter radicis]MBS9478016.1 YXWGXW repeat-containing protein [Ancylobacter radicis]